MNSYENKNEYEYEILDASQKNSNMSNRYSRYPLANNPQVPLQNTSYKDWLNMCQTITPLCTPMDTDSKLVATAIGVLGAIFKSMPGPGAAVGLFLKSFSTLIPILWPNETTPIWKEFTKQGLQLFRPELGRDAIEIIGNDVQSEYNALKIMMQDFEAKFATWELTRTRANAIAVTTAFSAVHNQIVRLKERFLIAVENRPAFLNLYAQTANIDLILYQRGAVNGDKWIEDINNRSISPFSSKDYYQALKLKIQEYTNYCAETYRNSLNILKNKSNIQWAIYNRYRREATLGALDLVALFPNYDICIYPIQTQTELTRKVYMPSFYLEGLPPGNIETRENSLTHPPSLFTWLKKLDTYTKSEKFNPALEVASLCGLQAAISYTLQNPPEFAGPFQGILGTKTIPIISFDNQFVYKLFLKQYRHPNDCYPISGIPQMTFYISDYYGNARPNKEYSSKIPLISVIESYMNGPQNASTSNNISIIETNHILSDIKMIYSQTGGFSPVYDFGYSFTWTHTSVDPNNLIVPNRITQIPAVKAYNLTSPARVIAGPGHTGGDLVALLNDGTQSGSVQIQCKTGSFTGASRRYGIRMRYAANNAFTVSLSYTLQGGNPLGITFDTERTFLRTNNIIPTDLKYEEFKYKEYNQIITMTSPQNTIVTINIRQLNPNPNNQLIIDRIEFYPVDQGVEACKVN
ncbi:insecticidal delta-endotoxin Cry8Ea1 family protein [Bacillus thuringiensis]|uniref:insecticidal delta-endotoxin Cry8Ea1 family protein n=1 Tax=Bacillus thuringiensis TaxID=1428 RepID=UPI002AB583FA|nr:insecticidal delta-endotoxin Cry8Ea1 family protein [Bacillus thuringiensis]MDY8166257.1 insecticidal delta-endotoxin Cry8Ea1 family protein [Bacillus thuringiensis]